MARAYNFSPGPSALPEPVLRQAQAEMLEYGGAGASIVEISHRGPEFLEVARRTEAADFVLTSMSAIAEKVTARRLTRAEVDAWAHSCADLLCHYVEARARR